MAAGIVPAEDVKPTLESPFGLKVFKEEITYPNPNRFFCHWIFYQYFNNIPLFLQRYMNPIDSAYMSCALSKTVIQIAILVLLSIAISGNTNIFRLEFILAAVLITPLFQTNGYRSDMGIIDPSTTYTFFYALPTALLLLYFAPLILIHHYNKGLKRFKYIKVLWIPFALISSLSGPLNPGIALVFSLLLFTQNILKNIEKSGSSNILNKLKYALQLIPKDYIFFLIPICLFSLYSLFLGRYNSVDHNNEMSLTQLYLRLPEGVYNQFTQKLGFPVLFSVLLINMIIINSKFKTEEGKKILRIFKWIGLFALVYTLLLPIGGYRGYRPNVLRYDMIIPITLSLMFIFGKTTIFIIKNISYIQKFWYLPLIILVMFIFTNSDEPKFDKNDCERMAIVKIVESSESVVKINDNCTVLAWSKIEKPEDSKLKVQLLELWGIINEKKLYYQ
ncbi:MAG: hypothetical protein COA57_12305 [Flavobacteriales bacterium]|nr:MAG: hypothetical protein COA57_12305 [Flavobacteriales bacterium]